MQKADCISLFKPRRSKFAFLQPLTKKITPARKVLIEIKQPILSFHEEKNYRFLFEQKVFHKKRFAFFFPIKFFFSLTRLPKFGSTSAFFVQQIKKLFRFYFSFSLHKKILSKPLNNFWPISFGDN